jgi:hypothetical protein
MSIQTAFSHGLKHALSKSDPGTPVVYTCLTAAVAASSQRTLW